MAGPRALAGSRQIAEVLSPPEEISPYRGAETPNRAVAADLSSESAAPLTLFV